MAYFAAQDAVLEVWVSIHENESHGAILVLAAQHRFKEKDCTILYSTIIMFVCARKRPASRGNVEHEPHPHGLQDGVTIKEKKDNLMKNEKDNY